MEWQQLKYFQTVANLQHISKAAKVLSITQPALSRAILRLEKELGVPLFERQKRTIILSQYGRLFLNHVNKMILEFEEGKQEIQDLLDPEHGTVSIGFLHTLGTHFVPDLIRFFREKHPNIKFQLHQNNSKLLIEQLEAGEIDLCFNTYRETKLDVKWVRLLNEELYLITPKNHPLAKSKGITLNQIADEPLICFKKNYVLRMITDQLCNDAGFVPKVVFEGEEVSTISGLVAAGLGVAIVPALKEFDNSKILQIRIKSPKCERIIQLAWIKGKYISPATQLFRQFVMEYFASKQSH